MIVDRITDYEAAVAGSGCRKAAYIRSAYADHYTLTTASCLSSGRFNIQRPFLYSPQRVFFISDKESAFNLKPRV
mgnify:CR=1 FL=1